VVDAGPAARYHHRDDTERECDQGGNQMRRVNQFLSRASIMGVATLMAVVANTAFAHETMAAMIGKTN
jgi:hypothetical protein